MSSKIHSTNKKYYSSKGKEIYSDFSTFAQGRALATCNAIEFCRDFSSHPPPVIICEYGIGKGDFAKTFLDEVKKRNKKLYGRTRYYLFDFSEKMLSAARKNLLPHRKICIFGKFDAAFEQPDLHFDYCRINELLTDLPAQIYMKKGSQVLEVVPEKEGAFSTKECAFPSPVVSSFLSRIEGGRAMPFNTAAERFLSSLCGMGKPRFRISRQARETTAAGWRIDIFDYGFYSAEDVMLLPQEEWNRLLVRNYGGQLTVDANFPQIISSLATLGIPAKIQKQKEYCEKVLGKKLEFSHTKSGLDYLPVKKQGLRIEEDDGFYHLRIGR